MNLRDPIADGAAAAAGPVGLATAEAARRLAEHGPNELHPARRITLLRRFVARLANPLLLVLLGASCIAALAGDLASFGIVALVVLMSAVLDLVQEHRADRAIEALQQSVALRSRVWRDGRCTERPSRELVPGDVVELGAGCLVPADGELLRATELFVDQATLTGESAPVSKRLEGASGEAASLQSARHVFMGTAVTSGVGVFTVQRTGADTELGHLAGSLEQPAPPTAFERGTRRFGMLLMRWTMALVLGVLLLNVLYHRPLLESFLFAVALAVGLTPELLPMIVSVTLARGALRMARQEVVVKRLSSIEDLGAMDVLCTDKTGTLTFGALRVEQAWDAEGRPDPGVLQLAWLNSRFATGPRGGLDDTLLQQPGLQAGPWARVDELPFDFERRRASVLLARGDERLLVTKGAPEDLLRLCASACVQGREAPLDGALRQRILQRIEQAGGEGLRLLGVARRAMPAGTGPLCAADECELVFAGVVAFSDPPKPSCAAALRELQAQGVALKVITGDSEAVARHVCAKVGIPVHATLGGSEIARLDDRGLRAAAARCTLFCRVTPEQKARIVRALRANRHVVGYLGDGANDAPPLHAADVGLSADGAVDVAKQAADIVLLRKDLAVLQQGVLEGRRTVVNVEKYILMATSSNFGNMVSMAAAALVLPFLPMRPLQILLNNLLYDVSELTLPLDRVDPQALARPQRWDIARIRRFMLVFGPLSSVFDLLAFALLLQVWHASEATFQTAWFVQSMATQVLVVFVIRTGGAAWKDRPSRWVVLSALSVCAAAVVLPWTPLAAPFGFVPLPPALLAASAGLTAAYLACAEVAKRVFHRAPRRRSPRHAARGA